MEVITFYSVILNFSAFAEPFFINTWVTESGNDRSTLCLTPGYTIAFVAQGMITLGLIPLCAFLQIFGARLRNWRGAPKWHDTGLSE